MAVFQGRRIVLVVTGGIAAYKAADLVSKLSAAGAEVRCILTENAARFVTPLTFQSLSGREVHTDTFDRSGGELYQHLSIAGWGEILAVAPATANILGKAACGIADDLASTALVSFSGPVLFAPAMNCHMWANAAVAANVETLRRRGANFVGPGEGHLACGEIGMGRMAEVPEILEAIAELLGISAGKPRKGKR
jgi:phosphopantothenoylcysteine decarboxylase/phosphopantothenate--cysteine ligase